jgi:prevent-host-death family protein
MNVVGAYDAKTHLSELLDRVKNGEKITITKHGVPVAVLQAPKVSRKREPSLVINELRKFREGRSCEKISIREMIEEGRRF